MSFTRATSHVTDDDDTKPGLDPKNVDRKSMSDAKPGSGEKLDLPHDFGAPVDDTTEVQYASRAALNQDPGRTQVRSNDERGGTRQAGAGTAGGGAGAGSGGDLDTDVVGFGRGLAASIPDRKERADSIRDARSAPASRSKPAKGENQDRNRVGISDDIPRGGTVLVDRDSEADGEPREAQSNSVRTTDPTDPYVDAAQGEITTGDIDTDDASSTSSPPDAER